MSLISEIKEFLGNPPSTPTHSAGGHWVTGHGSTTFFPASACLRWSGLIARVLFLSAGAPHRGLSSSMSVFICSQPESVCSTDLFVFDLIVSGEPEKQPAFLGNLPGLLWALRGVGLGHFSQLKLLRMCPFPTGEPGPRGNYRPR